MRPLGITLLLIEAVFGGAGAFAYETTQSAQEPCYSTFDLEPPLLPADDLAGIPDPKSKCITKRDVFNHVDRYYKPYRMIHGKRLADHVDCWPDGTIKKNKSWEELKLNGGLGWDYLATGAPIPYPGSVEHMDRLVKFMDEQKYFSINPEMLLKKAVEICDGNAHRALLTCWGVLSANWQDNVVSRNLRSRSLKLQSILGERTKLQPTSSEQRFYRNELERIKNGQGSSRPKWYWEWRKSNDDVASRGDEFSAWYHFFGTAVHAYMREADPSWAAKISWKTEAAVKTANFYVNNIYTGDASEIKDLEKREAFDFAGAAFGRQLAKNLKKNQKRDDQGCKKLRPYLTEDQASSGLPDDWALATNQRANDYGEDSASRNRLNEVEKTLIVIGLKKAGDYEKMRCFLNETLAPIRKSDIKNMRLDIEHKALFRALLDTYDRDKSPEAKAWLKKFIDDTKPGQYSHDDKNEFCQYAAEIYGRNFGDSKVSMLCYGL